jgi:hypothetical protein
MSDELKTEVIFSEGGAELVLSKEKKAIEEIKLDVTTEKGRKEIASAAYSIAKIKTGYDNLGKKYAEDLKTKVKIIDGERKKIWDGLEDIQKTVRKPLTEFEQREEQRIALIKEHLEALKAYGVLIGDELASDIRGRIDAIKGFNFSDWQEFEQTANNIKDQIIELLTSRAVAADKIEAERAELKRLQELEELRAKREHESRIAAEAAEKAKKDADAKAAIEKAKIEAEKQAAIDALAKVEAEKKAAELKAEQDRIAAALEAERQKQAAIDAERAKVEAEKKATAEAEAKRLLDREHNSRINNDILSALVVAGLSETEAKLAITAIAKGSIPHVKINY